VPSKIAVWIVWLLILSGCSGGLPDEISNTGYVGTWQRGSDFVQSTFSIVEIDGSYAVRWEKRSADGKAHVDCDWQGRCEEFVDGSRTSEYAFRVWVDEESGRLRVGCRGRVYGATPAEFDYVDELILRDDGHTLRFQRVADAIRPFDPERPPRRDYGKISDYVRDPPEGWKPPDG
jgi:hypothetical protein